MSNFFRIENKLISVKSPCYVIAEIGVNHNGDLKTAKKLIQEAKRAGADCVKFQTYQSENLVTSSAKKASYQIKTTKNNSSQFSMLKKLELKKIDYIKLLEFCNKKKISFMSTPYSIDDIDFLEEIGVSSYKVASMHLGEFEFLKHLSKKNKPFIVSTGMANQNEVTKTFNYLKKLKNKKFAILQCTSNYPTKYKEVNLNVIGMYNKIFKNIVGFSDHTIGYEAAMLSIAMGSKILEKHFTLDKNMSGPDHSSSVTPKELKLLISKIRDAEIILGSSVKSKSKSEILNEKNMKRSIVSNVFIKKNTIIEKQMLTYKRPGSGISPNKISELLGKKIKKNIKKDTIIKFEMVY